MDVFADPLGAMADGQWDELAGELFYSTALWLRLCALEPGGLSGAVHVSLPGGGKAAVPVSAVTNEQNPHCRWADILKGHGLPTPPSFGVLIGQRRGYLAHLLASTEADRTEAAAALVDAVRQVRSPIGETEAHVAMYLTTPDVTLLREAGVAAHPVAIAADAWIEIPGGSKDAWLHSLSKRARETVRRESRRFAEAGYRVEHALLRNAYHDVGRLTAATQNRHGHVAEPGPFVEAFRQHGEASGDRAEVLLLSGPGDEQPVGCCLYFRHADTIYARAVGFDYGKLRNVGEYFNLAFYILAGLPGVNWLHVGMESPEAKARRGARLRPLWLLDLSTDSVHHGREAEIRAHNRAYLDGLIRLSPSVASALETELWQPFC